MDRNFNLEAEHKLMMGGNRHDAEEIMNSKGDVLNPYSEVLCKGLGLVKNSEIF